MLERSLVTIGEISASRWSEYKDLRLEALKTDPQAFGSSYENTLLHPNVVWQARLEAVIGSDRNWLLFAEEANTLIGMIGASREAATANIVSVYVAKPARGRGISKMLLARMIDGITKSGAVKIVQLTVNKDQTPALTLYRSFGFEIVGDEEVLMGDGLMHTEYVLQKELCS